MLKDIAVDDGMPTWKKNFSKKKTDAERKNERKNSLETAFEACGIDDKVTVKAMAEYMGVSEKTVRRRLKEHGGFWIDEGQIVPIVRSKSKNVIVSLRTDNSGQNRL